MNVGSAKSSKAKVDQDAQDSETLWSACLSIDRLRPSTSFRSILASTQGEYGTPHTSDAHLPAFPNTVTSIDCPCSNRNLRSTDSNARAHSWVSWVAFKAMLSTIGCRPTALISSSLLRCCVSTATSCSGSGWSSLADVGLFAITAVAINRPRIKVPQTIGYLDPGACRIIMQFFSMQAVWHPLPNSSRPRPCAADSLFPVVAAIFAVSIQHNQCIFVGTVDW
jgi:hypothetical protein